MKNKKLFATAVAAALVATVGIGSTLAYLQDETGEKTNTFTIGNVKIDLDEPEWNPDNGKDMIPGATVDKNPIVTNVGQTEAFIGVRVDGMLEVVKNGFLVKSDEYTGTLDALYDVDATTGELELDDDSEVFAWNPDYKLVDIEGKEVSQGTDNVLTYGELKEVSVEKDVLFFAYNTAIASGAQTESLFDEVKLDTNVLGAPKTYTIVKHFVKDNANVTDGIIADELLTETNGLLDGTPKKKDNGEYIYGYTIENDTTGTVYATYDLAEAEIDAKEAADTTDEYEFNMIIKAAAIQSTNASFVGADPDAKWSDTESWYPELPYSFLND